MIFKEHEAVKSATKMPYNIGKGIYSRVMELADRNYYLAKTRYHYRLHRKQKQYSGSPLIVFQMGKVGSQSIYRSLEGLGLDMPLYHSHLLTKARIKETEHKRKKFFRTDRYSYLKRPWLNEFLRHQVDNGLLNGHKWKIVTLTREPLVRNISTFFENLDVKLLDSGDEYAIKSDYYDIDTVVRADDIQTLTDLFFDRINHDSPLVFFDRELKGVFGVDVYASEFPREKGYKIYEDTIADVLLIRLENLNDCVGEAFKEFLDIDNFTVIKTNVAADKVYAALYQEFRSRVALPDSYIDKFYNSKYMRHFYSETEIKKFGENWRR